MVSWGVIDFTCQNQERLFPGRIWHLCTAYLSLAAPVTSLSHNCYLSILSNKFDSVVSTQLLLSPLTFLFSSLRYLLLTCQIVFFFIVPHFSSYHLIVLSFPHHNSLTWSQSHVDFILFSTKLPQSRCEG